MARIEHIFVASGKGEPVQSVNSVEARAEQGLRGDRYMLAENRVAPDYQVTLIEMENIEAFTQSTGLPLAPGIPRRNIVTRGIRLNELCGKRFRVGEATFEGLELCEPCALIAKVASLEALKFFVRKGGLRACIVEGGEIRVGDFVGEDGRPTLARKGETVNILVQLGNYISTEQGFLRASTLGLGVPAAALGTWGLAGFGEVASLLVVPIAFAGAYVWGFIMWRLMFRDLYARKRALAEQTEAAAKS